MCDDSASRMKARREHRVPLCGRALEILDAARTLSDGGSPIVFITERGKPLDEKRLWRCLRSRLASSRVFSQLLPLIALTRF